VPVLSERPVPEKQQPVLSRRRQALPWPGPWEKRFSRYIVLALPVPWELLRVEYHEREVGKDDQAASQGHEAPKLTAQNHWGALSLLHLDCSWPTSERQPLQDWLVGVQSQQQLQILRLAVFYIHPAA
jgi:hypothetical protein